MARPKGSKVLSCPARKCHGRIVAMPGKTGICPYCGTKLRFTKQALKEAGRN